MACRYRLPGIELLLGVSLLAGCASGPRHLKSPAQTSHSRSGAAARAAEPDSDSLAIAHARYASALIHEMNGETEAALQDYYEAALNDPGNDPLVMEVSRRFLQEKKPEKALELLEASAARKDVSGALLARLGSVYFQQSRREEGIASARAAIAKSPDLLAGYQTLFVIYMQGKQTAEAWKIMEEAAKRQRPGPEFLASLAEMYLNYAVQVSANRQEANQKALALLDRAQKAGPGSADLRLKIADGFNLLNEARRAADIYLELLKNPSDTPMMREHIHAKLADLYLRGKDPKAAAEQLQALIRAFPTNPQAYYFLGGIAYDDKEYSKAAEYFAKTVLLGPEIEQAYYDLAAAQIASSQAGAAIATLEKAREKFGQNFTLELLCGMAYNRQKDTSKALEHFTAAEVVAKATDPKRLNSGFYLQLAAVYEEKGDYPEAERQARRALELSPDSPEALNFIGYMWADRNTNLVEARAMIEKAVKAEPDNAAYLDSLGWVMFRQGELKPALDYIQKAIELNKDPDGTLQEHLGDLYQAMGDKDKAREAWRKSIEIEPRDEVKKKLEENAQ